MGEGTGEDGERELRKRGEEGEWYVGRFKDGAAITPPQPSHLHPTGINPPRACHGCKWASERLASTGQERSQVLFFLFFFLFSCSVRSPKDKEMPIKRNGETRKI